MKRFSQKPRPAGSLKAASDDLVNAVGGQTVASNQSRVSRTHMARYTDPAEFDRYMPVDIVRVLEADAPWPHVTAFLAREAGFSLLKTRVDGDIDAIPAVLADVSREFGEAVAVTVSALGDLHIGPREGGEIIAAIDEALTELTRLRDLVRAGSPELKGGG